MKETIETVIIGAGISGLACAQMLHKHDKDFLLISKDIGGRILTSKDGSSNYGAFFVCSDYYNFLPYVKLHSQIKLSDFCFHDNTKTYVLYETKLVKYLFQFIRVKKILKKFRKSLRILRRTCETISQKEAIKEDPFLHNLYMQDAIDFIKQQKIQSGTNVYLSKALYSTTFSTVHQMNAFSFLQYLIPLITPIYTFSFKKEKMIKPFEDKILIETVTDIYYKNKLYNIKMDNDFISCKNIVLATQIDWSKKYAKVKKTNKPVSTNMLHIKGTPKSFVDHKKYQLFSPPSNVQAMADLQDGTYLFYYKDKHPNLNDYFTKHKIIAHHFWNPAGAINGHNLIESNRGNNMYLIGDFNIVGLEEAFVTGIYGANQIIQSK